MNRILNLGQSIDPRMGKEKIVMTRGLVDNLSILRLILDISDDRNIAGNDQPIRQV